MPARPRLALGLAALLLAGCGAGDEDDIDKRLAMLDSLVPATGVVKADGKPIPQVVVSYIPTQDGAPANGETDEDGKFSLTTAARPGALPGEYRVTLSYLIAKDGRILGLGPRSGFVPDPAVASADEKFPPEVSSLAKTTLKAVVPPGGGEVEFNVDAKIEVPAPPPVEADGAEESEKPKAAEAPQP